MEHFVTKEQVTHILKNHGHNVVGDSAFTTGSPISEIEAIVDVCDVIAQAAYDQGVKDATERHIDLQNQMAERVDEAYSHGYKNGQACALPQELNESEELEKAIETVQIALSGSFRDNMRLEVSEQHAWLNYGNLKFIVEPMEAWQAVQSCVYLSGLEVDNE